MIITEAELNELFDRFEMALADTEAWVSKEGCGSRLRAVPVLQNRNSL